MQISEVRLKKRDGDEKFLASGSITFEGMFVVSCIKVMRAKSGDLFCCISIVEKFRWRI